MRALALAIPGLLIVLQGLLIVSGKSYDENIRDYLKKFSSNRNNYVEPTKKTEARNFIINKFKDIGLDTWTETFPSNQIRYPGIHIVGRVKGKLTGTSNDKILIIGAHYDTVDTSNGVNDNGSGMSALLQAAQLYMDKRYSKCTQIYSLVFVAFDKEETQPACQGQSCGCPTEWLCGSYHFVKNLTSYIKRSNVGTVKGAFVMDTILNFNTAPESQYLPAGGQILFPEAFNKTKENRNRGDFLAVIGRKTDDAELTKAFIDNFDKGKYKVLDVPLPFDGRPRALSVQLQHGLSHFFRSDHYRFWNANTSWPAVHLSDTAEFRGYMKNCYHKICDDIDHVTSDMITFMTKTASALVKASQSLTQGSVCKVIKGGLNLISSGVKVTIESIGYPYGYYSDTNSVVGIHKGASNDYLVKFEGLDLEESAGCKNDYVELIRLNQHGSIDDVTRYCNSTLPKPFTSYHHTFQVRFVSDGLVNKKGFRVTWTRIINTPKARATRGYEGVQSLILVAVLTSILSFFDWQ